MDRDTRVTENIIFPHSIAGGNNHSFGASIFIEWGIADILAVYVIKS